VSEPRVPEEVIDGLRRGLLRMIDIEAGRLASLPRPYLCQQGPAPEPSTGCRRASFGWVHIRPGCRCVR
jgi:hypothetical protein